MDPLMNRVKEIIALKEKYNLGAYDVSTLNLLVVFENSSMTYEKLKKELIEKHEKN